MPLAKPFRQPIQRTSLADAVHQQLLEAILTGRLASGTELSEVALAAELHVSRTPVHEALRRLHADGLVHVTSARLAQVAQFTRQDVIEIYEMRGLLEAEAAERAATRLPLDALTELRAGLDALHPPEARNWRSRALEFDVAFHDRLAAACGNDRLRTEIGKYRRLVRAFCRMSGRPENLREACLEHGRILAAIEDREPQAARQAMAEHVAARLAAVLRELPSATPSEEA